MAKAKKVEKGNSKSLLDALNFAKVAFLEDGEVYQRHVILKDKMLYAFNGIIGAGIPIEEDIAAYPEGHTLRLALGRCKEAFGLTVDRDALRLTSGSFRAAVPCLSLGLARPFAPDPPQGPVGNVLKDAFAALAPLVNETGASLMESALNLSADFASATNRRVVAQYWHGIPLPKMFLLPKQAIDAVKNSPHDLAFLGYSANSVTFHFTGGSWIKSMLLHDEKYPDMNRLFIDDCQFQPMPTGFVEGVAAIAPFDDGGVLRYGPEGLSIGKGLKNASVLIDGINTEVAFYLEDWQPIAKRVSHADWLSDWRAVHFRGPGLRAVMQKYVIHAEPIDPDIPF